MKRLFTIMASAALLLSGGCSDDKPNYLKNPAQEETSANEGYLSFGQMTLRVIAEDATDTQDNNTEEATRAAADTYLDTSVYRVKIVSAKGDEHYNDSYAALQQLGEPLTLPVGKYTLTVSSEEASGVPALDWEHPFYGATKEFVIRKGETEQLGEVVCKLQNIKVTVLCSADLAAQLTPETRAIVSLKETRQEFALDERRAAYFQPQETDNTLVFTLKGKFITGEDASFTKEITGVKGGQWRKITLVNTHADKGSVKFDIVVDSFLLDQEIVVDGSEHLEEPPIGGGGEGSGGEEVKIDWAGHDFAQRYPVAEGMEIDIAAQVPAGIAQYEVHIISTELAPYLEGIGLPEKFDLCHIEGDKTDAATLAGIIHNLGFPINEEVRDKTELTISITNFVGLLINIPGDHDFRLTITDKNGKQATRTIQLKVIS